MRKNATKAKLAAGGRIVNGWCAIPHSYATEVFAHAGWDSVTVDMQHGPIDFDQALQMLQAISLTDATPMCRLPWNDPAMIMKLLDAGSFGLICPMVNTAEEAEAFVANARYAPRGNRSFGPNRAVQYAGADYWQHANEEVLLFAMIETTKSLDNLDAILATDSLSGTYIGPSDLSLSMGKTPTLAPTDKSVLEAIEMIRRKTKERGLIAGIHTAGGVESAHRFAEGFDLCTILGDARIMANAAMAAIREARSQAKVEGAKTY